MIEDQSHQYFEQEQELLTQLNEDTLQIVLSGYFTGTKFIFDGRYDIAIGCLTTAIGLCPLPYLYRLRAVAFLNRGLNRQALSDCEYYIEYHRNKHKDENERYMMDGLLMKGHIHLLSSDLVKAHEAFCELAEVSMKQQEWWLMDEGGDDDDMTDDEHMDEWEKANKNKSVGYTAKSVSNSTRSMDNTMATTAIAKHQEETDEDSEGDDGEEMSIVEALKTMCMLSEQLVVISEMPENQLTKQMLTEAEMYRSKLCMYCEEYEQVMVHWEVEWIAAHHAHYLNSVNIDTPLSITDIVKLASSKDINARSMGVVLMGGKFDGDHHTGDQEVIDLFVESGALNAISDSLRKYDDSELRFFATKALADICWTGDTDTRWQVVHEGFLPILCSQMYSSESDLIGITATTLGLLGRGGSGIDKIMREHGAIQAILSACGTTNAPNYDYCIQALSRLSGDTETKVLIVQHASVMKMIAELVKEGITTYSSRLSTTKSALIILGNVCQNPEIWGYPELYEHVEETVRNIPDAFTSLFDYVIGIPDSDDPDVFQLRMYAINAITQLLGFKIIREGIESCGGEKILYDILNTCNNSTLSQAITQAIRYYITLQHYGDHMKNALVPQYRLTPLSTISDTFDYVPSMMNSMSIPSLLDKSLKKIRTPTPPPDQEPAEDLLKILDRKIAKQKNESSAPTTNPNDDSISNIVSGLLNVASFVWTGDNKEKQPSKSKIKNQKKKQKKKAAKLEQKKLEEQKQPAKQKKEKTKNAVTEATADKKLDQKQSSAKKNKTQLDQTSIESSQPKIDVTQVENPTPSSLDPFKIFMQEFESGMTTLAVALNWG